MLALHMFRLQMIKFPVDTVIISYIQSSVDIGNIIVMCR